MGEKRKRPSNARESAQLKRSSTAPAEAPASPEDRSAPLEVPTSFSRDGPLPVLPERQPEKLPLKDFKSVAESKVMAESLIRSQRRWADGDIFERYWIKPLKSRKLEPADLEKNPHKDSMVRLGHCTLSCLPHKFEVKLFGVLEPVKAPAPPPPSAPPASPAPQPQQQQPLQRPPLPQSHPLQPNTTQPPPLHSCPTAIAPPSRSTGLQHAAAHTAPPIPPAVTTAPAAMQAPSPAAAPYQPQRPPAVSALPTLQNSVTPSPTLNPTSSAPNAVPRPPQAPQNLNHSQPQPPAPHAPRPDPVIQMLAFRAASDPDLKSLMRIVASGKATMEQLRIFQGHIDSLTPAHSPPIIPSIGVPRPMAHAQVAPGAPMSGPRPPQPQPHLGYPQQQHAPQQPLQHAQQPLARHTPYPPPHPQQYPPPQSMQAPKPKPFPQPPKQEVTSVVFEFVDPYSQGDRFMFPKHTILEYCNGGTMVKASFIVTRKPIDELDEYFQPITVFLESPNTRTLEIFHKVVADQETTCKYMKDLMQTRRRADDSFLAFRLRRDSDEEAPEKESFEEKLEVPAKTVKELRARRESSTPMHDSKATAQPVPSRPRIKTVKKALPREPPSNTLKASSSSSTPAAQSPKASRPHKPPRSRKGRIADPTKSCHICKTSKTSLWRKADIEGENVTVCNACGIKWKTNTQRAAQMAAAAASGQPLPEKKRGSSTSNTPRPTMQQLVSGGPQMQYHAFPNPAGFGPPQQQAYPNELQQQATLPPFPAPSNAVSGVPAVSQQQPGFALPFASQAFTAPQSPQAVQQTLSEATAQSHPVSQQLPPISSAQRSQSDQAENTLPNLASTAGCPSTTGSITAPLNEVQETPAPTAQANVQPSSQQEASMMPPPRGS